MFGLVLFLPSHAPPNKVCLPASSGCNNSIKTADFCLLSIPLLLFLVLPQRNHDFLAFEDAGSSLVWVILSLSVPLTGLKALFSDAEGRKPAVPVAEPWAWHLQDWQVLSPFSDLATTNAAAHIFQAAGGFAMFLPPTANLKWARRVELSSLEQSHTDQGNSGAS